MRLVPTAYTPSNFTGQTVDGLRLVDVLGEGAHGVVYRAVDENSAGSSSSPNPKEYAVKVQLKAESATREGQCQAREVVTHKIASDHPNVLTLQKVIEDDWFVFIITDYCPGGDLFTVMIEQRKYARDDALVKSIFVQILDSVLHIHNQGIYHRDLKPENILVSSDCTEVYLGDFGLATDVDKCDAFGCGSSYYMSPECIGLEFNFMPYSTAKADVWALGIILTNLITGRCPWAYATTDDEHFAKYLADNDYLHKVLPISAGANEILKQIFSFNPHGRIGLTELRESILAIDTFFMTDEELANANSLTRNAAAGYFPLPVPAPAQPASGSETSKADDGAAGYPNITPEDAYALVSPRPDVAVAAPPPRTLLTASRIFTIGSASDDSKSTSSKSSSGSSTRSTGSESSGPPTPEASAVDVAKLLAPSESLAEDDGVCFMFHPKAAMPKGPTPIHCLVQGIEEMDLSIF